MDKTHLLWWVYQVLTDLEGSPLDEVTEDDFESLGAPDWVWPAFEESYGKFKETQSGEIKLPRFGSFLRS